MLPRLASRRRGHATPGVTHIDAAFSPPRVADCRDRLAERGVLITIVRGWRRSQLRAAILAGLKPLQARPERYAEVENRAGEGAFELRRVPRAPRVFASFGWHHRMAGF